VLRNGFARKRKGACAFAKAGKISILESEMNRASGLGLCIVMATSPLTLSSSALFLYAQASGQAGEPVAYSSIHELNQLLDPLQQLSQTVQADLAKLRIERWKTDAGTKRQTQSNVDSLTRNLHDALPDIISGLRNSPESLPATFKLYRNLDALYDVFGSVTESTGAFGTKDEFQALDNDLSQLEQSRRAIADRMASLSAQKENELANLHTKLQQVQSAATPAGTASGNKVVVDDTTPAKKPVKHKPKPKAPATTPASTTTAPAAAPQTGTPPAANPN
jgi:hypothetical protein